MINYDEIIVTTTIFYNNNYNYSHIRLSIIYIYW